MTTTTRLLTAEDLSAMPDNGGRFELISGELSEMSPANSRHGFIAFRIGAILDRYVSPRQLGALFAAETGFIISRSPDTVLAPDLAFLRKEHIPATGLPEKFLDVAPDLAVEVISPSESWQAVEHKAHAYLAAGTSLVWVVNPKTEGVTVFKAGPAVHYLKRTDTISGENLLPGFSCIVSEFFT